MTADQVMTFGKEALSVAVLVAMPCLVVSVGVGLVISIFQATTQIHDQTLSFVPKILAVLAALFLFGGWMLRTLSDFTLRVMESLPGIM